MRNVFPVSEIAKYFAQGRTKIEYIKNHGLKRYYQNKFISDVKILIVLRVVSTNHGTTYLLERKWMFCCYVLIVLKVGLPNPVGKPYANERLKPVIHDRFILFLKWLFK